MQGFVRHLLKDWVNRVAMASLRLTFEKLVQKDSSARGKCNTFGERLSCMHILGYEKHEVDS